MQDRTDRPEHELLGELPGSQGMTDGAERDGKDTGSSTGASERLAAELEVQKAEHAALHDKYVRLHAEFDNFRKRTAKERAELLLTASASTLLDLLPVVDDMERAAAHNEGSTDLDAVKQGFGLIQQKLINILLAQGVKHMVAKDQPFDPDLHEAVGKVPAPEPALKGKVLEVVSNGYTLHDKVLRFAKVIVGD